MHDVIIIGGGPAGLTAGIYLARARFKLVLIEKATLGGQVLLTERIENYPGFPQGILGKKLVERMQSQAEKFGLKIIQKEARSIILTPNTKHLTPKIVKTEDKNYETLAIIIATGAEPKKLDVSGEKKLRGRGVSYCATCDGPLFRNKVVAVVGGGDTAVEEALFLTKFAKKVILIHRRDKLRATKILQERAFRSKKIDFIWDSVIQEVLGKERLEGLKLKNLKTDQEKMISLEGVFISVGIKPNTIFLKGLLDMDEEGYILTDTDMQASAEGIYACGDCRKKTLRQVITASGEGATAAFAAEQYVNKIK
jgi:thioredoxin reductase (NADPH)